MTNCAGQFAQWYVALSQPIIDVEPMDSALFRPSIVAPGMIDALEFPNEEAVPLKLAKFTTIVTPTTAALACWAAIGNATSAGGARAGPGLRAITDGGRGGLEANRRGNIRRAGGDDGAGE